MGKEPGDFKDILKRLTRNQFTIEDGVFEQASQDYFKMLRAMVDGMKAAKAQGVEDKELEGDLKEYYAREMIFKGVLSVRLAWLRSLERQPKAKDN